MSDFELSPLDALSDLPGAALRVALCLGAAIPACLLLLLGAMVANPYAGLPMAERERVDPARVSPSGVASAAEGESHTLVRLAAVAAARAQIGKPYIWGAAGPNGFDCSGLVQWSWAQVGVRIPKFTVDQYNSLQPVARDQLSPGDLVFLENTYPADYRITHVGMATERGTVIEAPSPGLPVREVPLGAYTATKYFGAARPTLPRT